MSKNYLMFVMIKINWEGVLSLNKYKTKIPKQQTFNYVL
jgi:hypothetical protein